MTGADVGRIDALRVRGTYSPASIVLHAIETNEARREAVPHDVQANAKLQLFRSRLSCRPHGARDCLLPTLFPPQPGPGTS
jgi:hypothetical protein